LSTSFSKIGEGRAILIEEFKQCIHSDIKTYIDEHNVSSLVKASNMADEYVLTHKLIFWKNKELEVSRI
jgi:hypothetical protein